MMDWWRNRKKRICIEKAEEIHSLRSDIEAAKYNLARKGEAFWSAPSGIVLSLNIRGQYPGQHDRPANLIVTGWSTIEAIRNMVLASEKAEVERLEANLNSLLED